MDSARHDLDAFRSEFMSKLGFSTSAFESQLRAIWKVDHDAFVTLVRDLSRNFHYAKVAKYYLRSIEEKPA